MNSKSYNNIDYYKINKGEARILIREKINKESDKGYFDESLKLLKRLDFIENF
jgi:hypothetical protein